MTKASRRHSFVEFFQSATGGFTPYDWQVQVALDGLPDVLGVPTGLGKTEVALSWAWQLLIDKNSQPLHLVYCLPMRSLVTQTVQRFKTYFDALKASKFKIDVGVHQLMGGLIEDDWVNHPEKPWILVGTQDQLLSRALNRGYAMSRFEWPVHFGVLNNDCRWIIDEVQLMGPGLWTTAQLDWMRRKRFQSLKPCLTTWMSATVGTSFLSTTDRTRSKIGEASPEQLVFEEKLGTALKDDMNLRWWRDAQRPVEWWRPTASGAKVNGVKKRGAAAPAAVTPAAIAEDITIKHTAGTLSLVICNTVDTALDVFRALSPVDHKVLLTSRFRREDRSRHEQRLLEFEANRKAGTLPKDDPGLICVSTQVVEAGMDISARHLWTELAPWPSMLQRFGRLNRKGDEQAARAWVWEAPKERGKKKTERVGPYEAADIECAKRLVNAFVAISQKMAFAKAIDELRAKYSNEFEKALEPEPSPLPRALDVHGLFSTERDVHGGFTDVSAFVRGSDPELDVTVFWRDWPGDKPPRGDDLDGPLQQPEEGCPVSFVRLGKMLESSKGKAWLWDGEADPGRWEQVHHWQIRPGMLVMLKREVGGYDPNEGWTGDASKSLAEVPRAGRGEALREDVRTEIGYWSLLDVHLTDARREGELICDAVGLCDGSDPCPICSTLHLNHKDGRCQLRAALVEAAGFHDIGKAHPQWKAALPNWSGILGIPDGLLAKTPRVLAVDVLRTADLSNVREEVRKLRPTALQLSDSESWRGPEIVRLRWVVEDKPSSHDRTALKSLADVCWAGEPAFRPGLRHEVASALAMWRKYQDGDAKYPALTAYLAATHHGKARTVLRSITNAGDDVFGVRPEPEELVLGNDLWPLDLSVAKDGADGRWEGNEFVLTGHGWTGLVADLLGPWRPEEKSDAGVVPKSEPRDLGPFALAYLEALLRVVDWRASANPSASVRPSEARLDECGQAAESNAGEGLASAVRG